MLLKNPFKKDCRTPRRQLSFETMAFKLKNLASAESGYIQRTDFSRFLFTQKISCLVLAFKELKPKNPESKLSNSRTELEENI